MSIHAELQYICRCCGEVRSARLLLPLKMRIRNLDEVFDIGVKVTKKLIELGKEWDSILM